MLLAYALLLILAIIAIVAVIATPDLRDWFARQLKDAASRVRDLRGRRDLVAKDGYAPSSA